MSNTMPIRTKMWRAADYDGIDAGVRFAVKVLHANGIETCQSCQGGEGHCYPEPSIDMVCASDDAQGFAALAALHGYGLPVHNIAILWKIGNGTPFEKLWRITFSKTMEDLADEWPMFEYVYRAYSPTDDTLERDVDWFHRTSGACTAAKELLDRRPAAPMADVTRLIAMERLREANSLLRSAASIASREGLQTNWQAFAARVKAELEAEHPLLYPQQYPEYDGRASAPEPPDQRCRRHGGLNCCAPAYQQTDERTWPSNTPYRDSLGGVYTGPSAVQRETRCAYLRVEHENQWVCGLPSGDVIHWVNMDGTHPFVNVEGAHIFVPPTDSWEPRK